MDFFWLVPVGAVLVVWFSWDKRRKKRRRDTLHQDSSGCWVWTDFNGRERTSWNNPDAPDGEWHSSWSSGDSGGFDGGGDGGGGD